MFSSIGVIACTSLNKHIYYQLTGSASQDINECLRELKIAGMQSFRSELGYQIKEKTAWPWALGYTFSSLSVVLNIIIL